MDTFTSGVYDFIIGSVLLTIDYYVDFGMKYKIKEMEINKRLIPVSTIFISILIIIILLSTFFDIFVLMQLASYYYKCLISRHLLSNNIKMQ